MAFTWDYNKAKNAAQQQLASQGMLSSTAAAGKMGELAQLDQQRNAEWDRQNQQFAEAQRQFNTNQANWGKTFSEQQRQNQQNNAFNWWNALNSLNLSKWQIGGTAPKGNVWANQPTWLSSYWTNRGLGSYPVGDPPRVPSHAEKLPDTLAKVQADRSSAIAQQEMALRNKSFAESVRQFEAKMQAEGYSRDATGRWVKDPALQAAKNREALMNYGAQAMAAGVKVPESQFLAMAGMMGVPVTDDLYRIFGSEPPRMMSVSAPLSPLMGLPKFSDQVQQVEPTVDDSDFSSLGSSLKSIWNKAIPTYAKVSDWFAGDKYGKEQGYY